MRKSNETLLLDMPWFRERWYRLFYIDDMVIVSRGVRLEKTGHMRDSLKA